MDIFHQTPVAARCILGRMQQAVTNPAVRLAWDLGLPIPGDTPLQTTGRRTRLPRRTPVWGAVDEDDTFWLVAQRGHDVDRVRNTRADPCAPAEVSGAHARRRAGTAHILDDGDPRERRRLLSQAALPRRRCMVTSEALHTSPPAIRVDLESE